jgi:predicted P-loop ATPase
VGWHPRIDTWLIDHLGADDNKLNRAFGRKFLLASVARVEQPGCKVDTALVLEGPQGLRKSTTARVLFGEYFSDHTFDLRDKDASQALQGLWCQEFPELSNIKQAQVEVVKAFLSRQEDRFRLPYGHITESYPRQTVFIITVNPDGGGYLKDATGARRFWTVQCGVKWEKGRRVDTDALAAARDQLWAEALVSYRNGDAWWLDSHELEKEQAKAAEARREPDPWEDAVATHVAGKQKVVIASLLAGLIGIELEKQTRREQGRMAKILTSLGWQAPSDPTWVDGVKARYWTKGGAA